MAEPNRGQESAAELLAMPDAAEIPFEPPRLGDLRLANVEQELLGIVKAPNIDSNESTGTCPEQQGETSHSNLRNKPGG